MVEGSDGSVSVFKVGIVFFSIFKNLFGISKYRDIGIGILFCIILRL